MKSLFLPALLASACVLPAQGPIVLINPSFEDRPIQGMTPVGWETCGFKGETPPDVQPSDKPYTFFGVAQAAYDGQTCIGMVVRDNETWESVVQDLKEPMKKGVEYHFSLFLCRSDQYLSQSRVTSREANYTSPAVLRIWGGNLCPTEQLLAQTGPVEHTEWQQYRFSFVPSEDWKSIRLEAYYTLKSGGWPYNGNILVDHCSALTPSGQSLPFQPGEAVVLVPPLEPGFTPRDAHPPLERLPYEAIPKPPVRATAPVVKPNVFKRVPPPGQVDEQQQDASSGGAQPLFSQAELYAMSTEQLEDYMLWWYQLPKPPGIYGGIAFRTWQFEKAVDEKGLVAAIEERSFSEFGALVQDLGKISLEKTLQLVEQIGRISRKSESLRSKEEQALYLAADDIFADNECTEPILKKRHAFIDAHRDSIVKELTNK